MSASSHRAARARLAGRYPWAVVLRQRKSDLGALALGATLAWVVLTGPSVGADSPAQQAAASRVVLGKKGLMGKYGRGWGEVAPRVIDNGGVPSGVVTRISWRDWGKKVASGQGKTSLYRPRGGYYRRKGVIKLRAREIGRCGGARPRAYRELVAKVQKKPGGGFGRWFRWSGLRTICKFEY